MSNVECHGSEEGLYLCPRSTIDNYTCHKNIKMAGVICSKEFCKLCCRGLGCY